MKSFRNPKYIQRYVDIVFDLETSLNSNVANNAHQKKKGYRFVADNTGEVTPFGWYDGRISIDFKVNLLVNGGNIAEDDHNGIVNGSYSFLKHFDINLNGKKAYDCNDANAVNIKNLLKYSPVYAESIFTNEFYFLDTSIEAEERGFTGDATNHIAKRRAGYKKGFALRKALQGTSSTVNTEISLKRYYFFEMLEDELLSCTRVELNLEIESDGDLIWQAGAYFRAIITRM